MAIKAESLEAEVHVDVDDAKKELAGLSKATDRMRKQWKRSFDRMSNSLADIPEDIRVAGILSANEWVRGADGRLRDEKGRFITGGERLAAGLTEGFTDRLRRDLPKIEKHLGRIGQAWFKTSLVLVAASGVQHASGLLWGLVGALGAASSSLLALPAAAGIAGAAVGTFAVGIYGLSDAFKALTKDEEAFKEATANLAPEARKMMQTIWDLKGRFDALRDSVQGTLFEGFSGHIRSLSRQYLPLLTFAMNDVAESMNGMAVQTVGLMKTPFFKGAVRDTFASTARAGNSFAQAIKPLGKMLAALITAGLPYMEQLAVMASRWARLTAATRTGAEWQEYFTQKIERGIAVSKTLGRTIGNVAEALGNLFGDRRLTPEAFVASIERLSEAFLRWSENTRNVQNVNAILDALAKILPALVGPAQILGRILGAMARGFNSLPGPVQEVIVQFLAAGLIFGKVLKVLGPLFRFLGKVGKIIGKVAGWVGKAVTKFGGWRAVMGAMGKVLLRFLGPIGLAIAAIQAIVWAVKNWDKIKQIAARVWEYVKKKTIAALQAVGSWVSKTGERMKAAMGRAWDRMVAKIKAKGGEAVNWVKGLPGRIVSALGNLGGLLVGAGGAIIDGLWDGLKSKWESVKSWFGSITADIPNLKGPYARDRKLLRKNGRAIIEGLERGLTSEWKRARRTLRGMTVWIRDEFGGGTERALIAKMRKTRQRIRDAHTREARLDDRLQAALARRANLRGARNEMVQSMSAGISSQANVLNAGNDAATIRASLETQVAKARQFMKNLRKMKGMGYSRDIISQVAAAGIEGGAEAAKALVKASSQDRAGINEAFKSIQKVAGRSDQFGRSLFRSGVQAANGLIKGLKSRKRAVEDFMVIIARGMQKAIKRALGIASPSKVMARLAKFIPEGLADGIRKATGKATKAATVMARSVTSATADDLGPARPPFGGPGAGSVPLTPASTGGVGRGGDVHFHFTTHNPVAEPQSRTTNKALDRVANLSLV